VDAARQIELFLGDWLGRNRKDPVADQLHAVQKPIFEKRARTLFQFYINNYTIGS
jgi:hypothetical protein